MGAWHGRAGLKAEVVERMLMHRRQDSIIQGVYQEYAPDLASKYRGCLIGCTLPKRDIKGHYIPGLDSGGWHELVEKEYGIPVKVAVLLDHIFEHIPAGNAAGFAMASVEAIPVGADLSGVHLAWSADILLDRKYGAIAWTDRGSFAEEFITNVATTLAMLSLGFDISEERLKKVAAQGFDYLASAPAPFASHRMPVRMALWHLSQVKSVATAPVTDVLLGRRGYSETWLWAADVLLKRLAYAPVPAIAVS